jgi:hypothetical protein
MMRLVARRATPLLVVLLLSLALAVAGCGGAVKAAAVPDSASLAPADAVGYVTLVTDEGSTQWKRAERLLDLFAGARDAVVRSIRDSLAKDDLSWKDDVAPAIGPEIVVVVTATKHPVVLTRADSEEKLEALLAASGEPSAHAVVAGGWTAIAETQEHLDEYRAAVARGTLEGVEAFTGAMEGLPSEALARAWVNTASLASDLDSLLQTAGTQLDFGIDSLSAAVSAEEDGVLLSFAARTRSDMGATRYERKLFAQVPADVVAALSFGGSQGLLDRLPGSVDLDAISKQLEDAVGVSLVSIVDALSGEGVLYVGPSGNRVPEITLALAPPNPVKTWETVDRILRKVAEQANAAVTTRTVDGVDVSALETEAATVSYARLDDDTIIVTTSSNGIARFRQEGPRLAESDAFTRAADRVGLGERTSGFLYLDIDGLIPFVEDLGGPGTVPADARDVLEKLDSLILLADGDGGTTRVSGFLRVNS